ncbi:hypothetical protein SAMN02799630_00378 [Paenibacillus sp. UNCCL117]|uniref:hypothetical protein n=1 Tax=unclassified Paenibacillus TaxID=185978 RepID=UPI00088B3490|nr:MULTISPECIES: hypothetical protein [unclassified Paenibacillus]SDC42151.1 hypothetical protein SAMN04488602_102154 [Paenibacillus sp. cl123]SFW13328.1 hypothetical protein SAMN02799630_00378 [Paenibacillus sp. UNCCL117]
MKIRLFPVLLSLVITAALLFGGYFAYQSYAMESPLQKVVSGIEGVELVSTHLSSDGAEVQVKLASGKSVREVYQRIQSEGRQVIGSRELRLKIVEEPSAKLDDWWASTLFEVAQAMETKQYAQIPATLEVRTKADPASEIRAITEMDDRFVYITLTDGQASKYVMLPRTPVKMGVWPNE